MTSADSLFLVLRRLDEIERKLDHIMEELRTPTAIGYSTRRGFFQGRTEADSSKSLAPISKAERGQSD
jgi:hypothetical protein